MWVKVMLQYELRILDRISLHVNFYYKYLMDLIYNSDQHVYAKFQEVWTFTEKIVRKKRNGLKICSIL